MILRLFFIYSIFCSAAIALGPPEGLGKRWLKDVDLIRTSQAAYLQQNIENILNASSDGAYALFTLIENGDPEKIYFQKTLSALQKHYQDDSAFKEYVDQIFNLENPPFKNNKRIAAAMEIASIDLKNRGLRSPSFEKYSKIMLYEEADNPLKKYAIRAIGQNISLAEADPKTSFKLIALYLNFVQSKNEACRIESMKGIANSLAEHPTALFGVDVRNILLETRDIKVRRDAAKYLLRSAFAVDPAKVLPFIEDKDKEVRLLSMETMALLDSPFIKNKIVSGLPDYITSREEVILAHLMTQGQIVDSVSLRIRKLLESSEATQRSIARRLLASKVSDSRYLSYPIQKILYRDFSSYTPLEALETLDTLKRTESTITVQQIPETFLDFIKKRASWDREVTKQVFYLFKRNRQDLPRFVESNLDFFSSAAFDEKSWWTKDDFLQKQCLELLVTQLDNPKVHQKFLEHLNHKQKDVAHFVKTELELFKERKSRLSRASSVVSTPIEREEKTISSILSKLKSDRSILQLQGLTELEAFVKKESEQKSRGGAYRSYKHTESDTVSYLESVVWQDEELQKALISIDHSEDEMSLHARRFLSKILPQPTLITKHLENRERIRCGKIGIGKTVVNALLFWRKSK